MKLRYLFLLPAFLLTTVLTAGSVAVCASNVNVALPADACTITLTPAMIDAGSYDTNGFSFSLSLNGHRNLGPGYHNVVLTASGRSGYNSCWSRVLVEDKVVPSVHCTDQTHYLVAPDQNVTYNIEDMVSITDNCVTIDDINITVPDNNSFGSYPFSASATDGGGNVGLCYGTVTTIDAEPQNYCSSSRNAHYEHISNIQLGSINHSSGADGGYNWNYPTGSNTLYHGSNYNLSYAPGFSFSFTYQEYWSVYIDKNGDGDFTDSGELLHQWHGYGGNSFNFTSPGTYWGWSRIRVVMRYGGYATSPCGGGGYGETEDISVYLRPYFWFPWPGFKQGELLTEGNNIIGQELELGSARPVEEIIPGEAAQRRQLIASAATTNSSTAITGAPIKIFPNPAKAGQAINITGQDEDHELLLRNMSGQLVKTFQRGTTRAYLPGNLPTGIYLLSGIGAGSGASWTRRVVVK
ncbi:GEVED domain-containing protein [Neolewinella persica]|uniref:GEVED domain-containing protein n=1 Tax=Neolewinella persica TaxID=70998 RepID=UPI0003729845|nr:GEVED domain-containing protein [Neolewinella persica]